MQNTTQATQQSAGMGGRVGQQGQGQHRACTTVTAQAEPLYRQSPYGAIRISDFGKQQQSEGQEAVGDGEQWRDSEGHRAATEAEPLYRHPPYGAVRISDLSPRHSSIGADVVRAMASTHNPFELLGGVDTEGWTAGADQQQPAQQTPPQQQPAQQQQQDVHGQQFAAWLFQMMQGLPRRTGYKVVVLLAVLCLVVKVAMVGHHLEGRGETILEASGGTPGDSRHRCHYKGSGDCTCGDGGQQEVPVLVHTANDITRFYECADLPLEGNMEGSIDGAVVMEHSKDSIQPVVPVCEEMDLGFHIAQGGGSAMYYRMARQCRYSERRGSSSQYQWMVRAVSSGTNVVMVGWWTGGCVESVHSQCSSRTRAARVRQYNRGSAMGQHTQGTLVWSSSYCTQHWWWGPSTHTTPHSTDHSGA